MATRKDFTPVIWAYVACILAAAATLFVLRDGPFPVPWDAFIADVVATIAIFMFSRALSNSSMYDAYWSVIPPLLVLFWWWQSPVSPDLARALVVSALVWFWGIRLTANWAYNWPGLHHEDWRYPMVREKAGRFAIPADFLGIHLFPTVQVFLGCLPVFFVMTRADAPWNWLDTVATVVTLGAILIEMIADLQLHAYLKTKKNPGDIINTGLWAWSRHPNYFGEVSFWWGLLLFGLAAAPDQWMWIIPGAIAMTLMFAYASIPMMDRRSVARRPAYAEHMQRVSGLVPLPPKRG